MKKMSKKILFFGNERLATGVITGAPTLQALIAAGYEIPAVVVAQNEVGRSRQVRELEVATVAKTHSIPVISPADLNKARNELSAFNAKAAVLIAYGKIVPEAILNLFPHGIINIHPSLLPKHRGPTPIESAILQGDTETGVSLMRLSNEMDAGPVYAQKTVLLRGDEIKPFLATQLLNLGKDMLLEHLPGILSGELEPTAQDGSKATYDKLIEKSAGKLDFNKPATVLEQEIRAYTGWPRSRTTIGTTDVIITKAHVSDGKGKAGNLWIESKQLGVYSGEGVLIIDSLIPAGKKEMSAQAFLAGR